GTDFEWWLSHIHPDDRDMAYARQRALMEAGQDQNSHEHRFRTAAGNYIWVASRTLLVRDETGRPVRLVGSMLDITARKEAEARLKHAAFHDPLTDLPNRTLYGERLDAAIAAARESGCMVGLMVLDLNNFKMLNDTMGH